MCIANSSLSERLSPDTEAWKITKNVSTSSTKLGNLYNHNVYTSQ